VQKSLAEKITAEGLSVRQVEEMVRGGKGNTGQAARKTRGKTGAGPSLDADTKRCIEELQYRYGSAVRISGSDAKGRIEVQYAGTDDRARILNLMLARAG
jgi:ParB family chromosome partitioning protein